MRTGALFGAWVRYSFLYTTLRSLRMGEAVVANDAAIISPTYVPDLVHASLDLLLDGETGVWHLTNQGAVSWHELAREVADLARVSSGGLRPAEGSERTDTSLSSERCLLLRPLEDAMADFVQHSEPLRDLPAA